jgi:hypothetical protein
VQKCSARRLLSIRSVSTKSISRDKETYTFIATIENIYGWIGRKSITA